MWYDLQQWRHVKREICYSIFFVIITIMYQLGDTSRIRFLQTLQQCSFCLFFVLPLLVKHILLYIHFFILLNHCKSFVSWLGVLIFEVIECTNSHIFEDIQCVFLHIFEVIANLRTLFGCPLVVAFGNLHSDFSQLITNVFSCCHIVLFWLVCIIVGEKWRLLRIDVQEIM